MKGLPVIALRAVAGAQYSSVVMEREVTLVLGTLWSLSSRLNTLKTVQLSKERRSVFFET